MNEIDIIQQIKSGEVSKMQFKERLLDSYDIGCELVAFSNARGGTLVVGVKDKTGSLNPLSYLEVQETTNTLSNIASENVVPAILVDVETISVDGGSLVVAHIKEGVNKPYHDNRGIVWVKNGADKRKVFDNVELAEMMTDCGSFSPDEAGVRDATIKDLDENTIKTFLSNKFEKVLVRKGLVGDAFRETSLDAVCSAIASGHDGEKLLRNLRFIRPDGKITVAAMLLFGKYTQRWLPAMTAKCICFVGNNLGGTQFRDKVNDADIEGNLLHQFETVMDFFTRNLRHIQVGKEFNSQGVLEISYISLVEFTVNALVHRSLNATAPIRIFIFDDRVEIHSPGILPNGLSVDDIVVGTSMPRNMFLFTNAIHLLPYTGAGSGMLRALSEDMKVSGLIEIKSVSRDPGSRSKVAVYSQDKNIDPVGSCVGQRGIRIQNIINELNGEKIDVIEWSEDPATYIAAALLPAKIMAVDIKEEEKFAQVIVPDEELSLAIGKAGQNARLAAKLTNWKIDIKSESQFREMLLSEQNKEELSQTENNVETDNKVDEEN